MGNHKKQKRRAGQPSVDEHHILYPHSQWNEAGKWSKLLRSMPYYKKIIPVRNLHNQIHIQVKIIPPPSSAICKEIYEATIRALDRHEIDADYDTIERRIEFFLSQLEKYSDPDSDQDFSDTTRALLLQSEIVARYYSKSRPKPPLDRSKLICQERYGDFFILYPSKIWGVKGYSKILSENSYFKIRIPKDLVGKIHREIHTVQKPKNGNALKAVNQQLEHARRNKLISPCVDSPTKRIQFLIDSFRDWYEYPTCQDLEKMLCIISDYYQCYNG